MFARAPGDGPRFLDFDFLRFEASAGVRPVAEWLAARASAGTPPIGARFDLLDDRFFLVDNWFSHGISLENRLSCCCLAASIPLKIPKKPVEIPVFRANLICVPGLSGFSWFPGGSNPTRNSVNPLCSW